MAITSTSQTTAPVNVVFQRMFLERARALAPYFTGTQAAELVSRQGSFTAKWRRYENLDPATTPLSELTGSASYPTRSASQPSVTDITAQVQKYGDFILLNEEADLVNFNGQTMELLDVLAIQAGRTLNMLQRNEEEDNSTQIFAGGAASDGAVLSKITTASLDLTINTLARNVAMPFVPGSVGSVNIGTTPVLQAFWGICHPDVAHDIADLGSGFTSVEKYAGQVQVVPGEFGIYSGAGYAVRFVQTSDASIDEGSGDSGAGSAGLRADASDNANLYTTVIYGMNSVASVGLDTRHISEVYRAGDRVPGVIIINKPFGSAGSADALDELSTLGWKSWHAAKITNGDWIRGVRSAATDLS